jgi:outer membrane lipoprotein-sorting protein
VRRDWWALPACLGAVALLQAVLPVSTSAQDRGMEVLQQASRRYAPVASLCADFVQLLRVPLLGQEETARGRLCQQRPNLFAMRFTEPSGDLIVVDGTSMWYYMPNTDAKQVFRFPIARGTGGLDFHREFLEDPELKYDVTYEASDEVSGTATHRLRLRPKQRTSYRAAVLWIEHGTSVLRVIRLEEENGNERTINLRDVALGASPPAGFFAFTPPPGALVIDP